MKRHKGHKSAEKHLSVSRQVISPEGKLQKCKCFEDIFSYRFRYDCIGQDFEKWLRKFTQQEKQEDRT